MGYEEITNVNAVGLTFIFLMGILVVVLPRRYAIVPIAMTACYITLGQALIVSSLHVTMMRLVILIGLARVFIRGEVKDFKINKIDVVFGLYVISNFAAYYLLRQTSEAFINRAGFAYDALGSYFLFRSMMQSYDDVRTAIAALAVIVVPLSVLMIIEYFTGRNTFAIFGGVPEITIVRDGRMRCQGPFAHPILAGTFGATTFPFVLSLWHERNRRLKALAGIIATVIITITCGSSGPLMTLIAVIAAIITWKFRKYLKGILWTGVATAVVLHIVMKAPVWYLIGKLSGLTGGTGWHRAELINQAIVHFDEWWLMGTEYTRHWMPTGLPNNPNMTDITSMYIRQAVDGGFLTMMLFILVIFLCFRSLGKIMTIQGDTDMRTFTVWCMGAVLFGHAVSFTSVRYFDQVIIFWYMLLAMIGSLVSTFMAVKVAAKIPVNT